MAIEEMEGLEHKPIPVIFLIDTSGSMSGPGITQVNNNMREYVDAMRSDAQTKDAVQLTIVTFSDTAKTVVKFEPISTVQVPALTTQTSTNLASGLSEVMKVIQEKADFIKSKCKRPLLVFMTDGNITGRERSEGNVVGWMDEIDRMNSDYIMSRSIRVALGAGNGIKDSTLEAFKLNPETDVAVRIGNMKDLSEFFKYLVTITREVSKGLKPSKPIGADNAGSVAIISP